MDVEKAIRTRRTHKAFARTPVPPAVLGAPAQEQRVPARAPLADVVSYLE